jgi:NTE family protein
MTFTHTAVAVALALLVTACAADPPGNPPLLQGPGNRGYEFAEINARDGRPDLVVMVSFSGGGKRSAAFAHGALRAMRGMPVPGPDGRTTTLLEEVDQIAAVSGGAFPAAHYALYRERSFETFREDFLDRDIESFIWGTFLLPWNWTWLFSASHGTNDRMAAIYNHFIFRGATMGDVMRQGRPRLAIGATELSTGVNFAFLPFPFDLICSDLARFPLARAVAASNGFPVLFTPITLANHRGSGCTVPLPPFPEPAAVRTDLRQRQLDGVMRRFSDAERTPYVHLMDGGIADNLAMRYVLLTLGGGGERGANFAELILPARRILMLVVDGQASNDPALARQRVVYGLGTVVNAVSGGQIDNYNLETLALARIELERLAARRAAQRCRVASRIDGRPCDDVRAAMVRVAISDHPDEAERARLLAIRTGLTLPAGDVDRLLQAGEALTRGNRDLRDFLDGVDAPVGGLARGRRQ